MLYHLTNPEHTESIRETGLTPRDNSDAVDPLRVAEEIRDELLDQYARERFGDEYPARRWSVFFYADPVFAATEAEATTSATVVVDESELTPTPVCFSADRNRVEDLFATIREGVYDGGISSPTYDETAVEAEAKRIVTEDFQQWDGEQDANREVWCATQVPPEAITELDTPPHQTHC